MAVYTYIAQDERGNRFSGTYHDVRNATALRRELAKIGYGLVEARRVRGRRAVSRRIPEKEVIGFAFQFAGMYSAGLSVLHCLETLEEQTECASLRAVLVDIREAVETGASLHAAFTQHPRVFGPFFLGMIEAGEAGAKLGEALEVAASYLEKRSELRHRVRAAFVYPGIVATVALLVIGGMLTFVVPMFARLYGRMHVALPLPTQVLIGMSQTLQRDWLIGAGLVGGAAVLGRQLLREPRWRLALDHTKLRIPIFGRLNRLMTVSRFVRTFATLLSVGVPLVDAIEVARVVARNTYWDRVVAAIKATVQAGQPVAQALGQQPLFPRVIVRMADSGEQSGTLPTMLTKAADFLDREIDRTVSGLLTKLEPTLTVALGGIIGLLLIGVYLPMLDYMNHLK